MEKNKEINEEKLEKGQVEESKFKKFIKELVPYVLIIIIVLFVKTYIISPIQVNGASMDSTLKNGDIMILNKLQYKRNGVKRFDIIVLKHRGTHIIKRVIGLPGDTVQMKKNVLYINGEKVNEPYLDKGTVTEDFKEEIPANCYYVLGDNREESLDSTELGCFDEKDIEGIAKLTIFPLNRIGNKK